MVDPILSPYWRSILPEKSRRQEPIMRIIAIATFCALAALPVQAQQVDRIKATGANAAGACAGSLEMIGQYLSRVQQPDARKLAGVQEARDFFADLPNYPATEISAAANAFIQFMQGRLDKAATAAERQTVEREILQVSTGCAASAQPGILARRNAAAPPAPAIDGTVQPYVAPPVTAQVPATQPYVLQPSTVEPYAVQPSIAQPYSTEPLLLDPAVPSQ